MATNNQDFWDNYGNLCLDEVSTQILITALAKKVFHSAKPKFMPREDSPADFLQCIADKMRDENIIYRFKDWIENLLNKCPKDDKNKTQFVFATKCKWVKIFKEVENNDDEENSDEEEPEFKWVFESQWYDVHNNIPSSLKPTLSRASLLDVFNEFFDRFLPFAQTMETDRNVVHDFDVPIKKTVSVLHKNFEKILSALKTFNSVSKKSRNYREPIVVCNDAYNKAYDAVCAIALEI